MTFIVGLTGGIGSGKSTAARLFEELGVTVIDTDAIAHELTRAGGAAIEAIRAEFGPTLIDAAGALDRAAMRALAFTDPAARARLERILHPLIRAIAAERTALAASPYVILMIPLLVEGGGDRQRCQRVLVVDCPEPVQVTRVRERSALAEDEVRRIMATQVSRQRRLEAADDVIGNSGSIDDLRPQVARLHRQYCALAGATAGSGG